MSNGTTSLPIWLLEDPEVSMNAKMVYLALTTFNGRNGCYPRHSVIAERCARSVSSVQRGLEELRDLGMISWTQSFRPDGSGQSSNEYTLLLRPA